MGYHDLKILHIFSAMLMLGLSVFLLSVPQLKAKFPNLRKYLFFAIGLSTLGSGLVIMGRFGLKPYGPYPTWIAIKLGIWAAIFITTPLVAKFFPQKAIRLFLPWSMALFVAVAFSVYKPM